MILTSLHSTRGWPYAMRRTACMLLAAIALPALADTKLADQPLFTNTGVPGNLALSLSVEYPTAVSVAHPDSTYSTDTAMPYLGYFDPHKCYEYVYVASPTNTNLSHFKPVGQATKRICSGSWSGNFLNWATMQTIDPFRWALTGGYRVLAETRITPTPLSMEMSVPNGFESACTFWRIRPAISGDGVVGFPAFDVGR